MFILKTGHQPGVYVPLRALFLVFTIFAFYHEIFLSQNCKKYFSTKNMYIWAKILSYIVVREL